MSLSRLLAALLGLLLIGVAGVVLVARLQLLGRHLDAGTPTDARVPDEVVAARARADQRAGAALTTAPTREVLFGDLHVHTTFSTDAFLRSLPLMASAEGAHPVSDACDYARFCSALDFWSINDHAEASTPRRWSETVEAIRQCNAIAGDPERPDVTAFLGWEWSQVGRVPAEHYGHKNVILRDLEDGRIPARPIGAAGLATDALRRAGARAPWYLPLIDPAHFQRYSDFLRFLSETIEVPACAEGVSATELPADCYESAGTPAALFEKLRQWGVEAIVIPHGTTWGFYSPPGTSLDKQLAAAQNDPERQFLFEIMSGHGNSEEYRAWREVELDAAGKPSCPAPGGGYLPSCWRAGELVEQRCLDTGSDSAECAARAEEARRLAAEAGIAVHRSVPGSRPEEWLDAGQCRDCFLPSFNYRPRGSGQYGLAISNFDAPGEPRRFRFGFIAASDNHSARPGTGYKEIDRLINTETTGAADGTWQERMTRGDDAEREPRAVAVNLDPDDPQAARFVEAERQSAFFMTGGLAAVHAEGRSRSQIWEALQRKEAYGTSGERILLWFHLLNAERPDGTIGAVPMGGEAELAVPPRFEVRAVGAQKQLPGCPEHSVRALSGERLQALCRGECFHPSDERKRITRIEVVRIRPQARPGEDVTPLIEDPWRRFDCEPSQAGCVVQFEDPDFVGAGRDSVYYVRAIQEPSETVNAGHLRCTRTDDAGRCLEVDPCWGDYRTEPGDDCTAPSEERAWSSPIYVDHAGGAPAVAAADATR
jgi:hypothetical protein